ncbi:MAG: heme exporter protein CcmB [Actinomycetota bacterium]|nr:heme exporter protein CcmB [Actinomycetota bacterium]
MTGAAGFVPKTAALIRKDLRIEGRKRDTLPPMLAFTLAVVLLLAFSLPDASRLDERVTLPTGGSLLLADVLAGFLWVTVLFAGLIGFARTFEVERDSGALDVLLLVPLDRSGLFAAKAVSNLIFVIAVEAALLPVYALMFGIDLGARWAVLALVALLVDIGFVAVGTLFSSLAAQTSSRELMLPLLALPALVPIFIAATELTSDLFAGGDLDAVAARGWFAILAIFDVVFATAGALAFDFALD